jgi:hypothetical protein
VEQADGDIGISYTLLQGNAEDALWGWRRVTVSTHIIISQEYETKQVELASADTSKTATQGSTIPAKGDTVLLPPATHVRRAPSSKGPATLVYVRDSFLLTLLLRLFRRLLVAPLEVIPPSR